MPKYQLLEGTSIESLDFENTRLINNLKSAGFLFIEELHDIDLKDFMKARRMGLGQILELKSALIANNIPFVDLNI